MSVRYIEENLDMDPETQRKLDDLTDMVNKLVIRVEVMSSNISSLDKAICEIKASFVTLIEFKPVRTIVFALVGSAGFAVLAAILSWVVLKKP